MTAKAHQIVTSAFKDAQSDPKVEQQVEDLIAERLREIGFVLTDAQEKCFTVDSKWIKEQGGPSSAAAVAISKIVGSSWRTVYEAKSDARNQAPVPGPFNRWVDIRNLRLYLDRVLTWADAQRRDTPALPLDALRSDRHVEALMDRVERLFKRRVDGDLRQRGREQLCALFLALLRGENPACDQLLQPDLEAAWARLRPQFKEIDAG